MPVRTLARLRTTLALVWSIAAAVLAHPARAQEGSGAVEGTAAEAESGRPLAYALVRLLPVAPRAGEPVRVLTGADGRFRIPLVPPGEYHLQLDRIGFEPARSGRVLVEAGRTARVELRGAARAIVLAPLAAGPRCLTARELPSDPTLAALWAEAKKNVETRRAFNLQHRYRRVLRDNKTVHLRLLPDVREVRADTQFGTPDSVSVRERERQERNRAGRYVVRDSGRWLIHGLDELTMLHEEFLVGHCLSADVAREPGLLGFAFRPVRVPESGQTVRGTLWMDSATFRTRRVELQYNLGTSVLARMRLDYSDVPVGGGPGLRLPTGGTLLGYPRGMVVRSITSTLELVYDQFEPVPPR